MKKLKKKWGVCWGGGVGGKSAKKSEKLPYGPWTKYLKKTKKKYFFLKAL
jgi:hypothetical protein